MVQMYTKFIQANEAPQKSISCIKAQSEIRGTRTCLHRHWIPGIKHKSAHGSERQHNLITQHQHVSMKTKWRELQIQTGEKKKKKGVQFCHICLSKAMQKLPLVAVFSEGSLQQALMLSLCAHRVQTQNKLIPWHCSISTPSPRRLLHSTLRAKQRRNKHQEEYSKENKTKKQSFWYADLIHKSSWLLSPVVQ